MLRLLLIAALLINGPVMARDSDPKGPKRSAQPRTSQEQFWETQEGQDIDRLFQQFISGEKTFDQAYDEMRAKHHGGKDPYWNKIGEPPNERLPPARMK